MESTIDKALIKELAHFLNALINIPYLTEAEEQYLYEFALGKAITLLFGDVLNDDEAV